MALTHLQRLEAEALHIIREACADAERPVLLFSGGKDSTVLAHLVRAAFHPARPPLPLLHIDSTFEFPETLEFRDSLAAAWGFQLVVRRNEAGARAGVNPFGHGSSLYTSMMRTEPLRSALDQLGADVILGGARRDEEISRAKERIVSVRGSGHAWDPRAQRPELWRQYNTRRSPRQTLRVFPLSNWTEADIWAYIRTANIPLAPLYFSAPRPVVARDGALLVVVDERFPLRGDERPKLQRVRFRTVGCWPVTAAVESQANTLEAVIRETLLADTSERQGRLIDVDDGGSLETKKREGYF